MPNEDNKSDDIYLRMSLKNRILTKLIMRFPAPRIPFFISKKFPSIEGIFHGLIMPLLLFVIGLFMLWLLPTATLMFGFPLNVLITLLVPVSIFAMYIRIELERTMNWWRSIFNNPLTWDSSKSLQELIELFENQEDKKND